jgi:hypothetical protein
MLKTMDDAINIQIEEAAIKKLKKNIYRESNDDAH